ncbi:MAG: hypothetical protein ACRCT8_12040 [Lacipirellulaceae bacterium]
MPPLAITAPMIVAGAAAGIAARGGEGILPADWSLPLTCLAGACMGGVLAVVMVPTSEPRTVRGEGVRWLGAATTATVIGPAACQWLPAVNADNVLALSGLLGFMAWPLMTMMHKAGPAWFRAWLDNRGAKE